MILPPKIKIFGAYRSGTNWLSALVYNNFEVLRYGEHFGSKHEAYCIPELLGHDMDMLVVSKNPLSWYASLARYKQAPRPIKVHSKTEPNLISIGYWNQQYRGWLDVDNSPCKKFVVRYEDLLVQTEALTAEIGQYFGWTQRASKISVPRNRMNKSHKETAEPFCPGYYTQREYMWWYEEGHAEVLWNAVDKEVLQDLGYSTEAPRVP